MKILFKMTWNKSKNLFLSNSQLGAFGPAVNIFTRVIWKNFQLYYLGSC